MSSIGIMEGAYFVSRGELLRWINGFLHLNYTKVEQVCSGNFLAQVAGTKSYIGVAYCQLLDALFPGKVPLSKVNFEAKTEWEYAKNFKIVQEVFDKIGIEKVFLLW